MHSLRNMSRIRMEWEKNALASEMRNRSNRKSLIMCDYYETYVSIFFFKEWEWNLYAVILHYAKENVERKSNWLPAVSIFTLSHHRNIFPTIQYSLSQLQYRKLFWIWLKMWGGNFSRYEHFSPITSLFYSDALMLFD